MNENECVWDYPTNNLSSLDTNYIIFKIIENFQIHFFSKKIKIGEGKALNLHCWNENFKIK